jgi:hypothetical protein
LGILHAVIDNKNVSLSTGEVKRGARALRDI